MAQGFRIPLEGDSICFFKKQILTLKSVKGLEEVVRSKILKRLGSPHVMLPLSALRISLLGSYGKNTPGEYIA